MASIGRRGFVKGATLGALAFSVGGVEVLMTPNEARARNVPFRLLDGHQGETLEALGETLVPKAREAGIAHYIDQQLSVAHRVLALRAIRHRHVHALSIQPDSVVRKRRPAHRLQPRAPTEELDMSVHVLLYPV